MCALSESGMMGGLHNQSPPHDIYFCASVCVHVSTFKQCNGQVCVSSTVVIGTVTGVWPGVVLMNFCFNTQQLLNICPGQWENTNREQGCSYVMLMVLILSSEW